MILVLILSNIIITMNHITMCLQVGLMSTMTHVVIMSIILIIFLDIKSSFGQINLDVFDYYQYSYDDQVFYEEYEYCH